MNDNADVCFNPLKIFVFSLAASFLIGQFIDYVLLLPLIINILGLLLLIIFFIMFFISARVFFLNKEKLPPSTPTNKLIKTGIYSYIRNPIYTAFICFQISMFLLFENLIYIISSVLLFFWIHFFVVLPEETYLLEKFGKEYERYKSKVPRWIFF